MGSNKANRITRQVMMMSNFKVTAIQFFRYEESRQISDDDFETIVTYSANVAINDDFIIQCDGSKDESNYSIPSGVEACWNDDETQDLARESFDIDEIIEQIEADGFENNMNYLEENGDKM